MSNNPIFSYTKRDYERSRQEGLAQIPALSKGNWTDLNASDPGIIILDYVHALVDMINYYQDHQALESFLVTAKERSNLFRLAKQLSYSVKSAKGAELAVTFHSDFKYNYPIKIPKYTQVSTERRNIVYLTKQDAYLEAGATDVDVLCIQGTLRTTTYQGTGISRLSNIERAANQEVTLYAENIDISTIRVTDSANRLWTPVEYIVFSNDLDRVYQADLNPDNTVTIKFGDGERGIVPKDTDTLIIEYVVTDAELGRVSKDSIINLDTLIYNNTGNTIELLVSNKEDSTGGESVQSSTSIRELAPGAVKAQDRAVTLTDFENLARLVDGVKYAKAYDINTNPDLCLYHEVRVLIVPKDSSYSEELLKDNVYKYLYDRMIPPTNLQVFLPTKVEIDIKIKVRKMSDTYDSGTLQYTIYQSVVDYFNNRAGDIGEDFYPTDLSTIIANIEGIRYIESVTPVNITSISAIAVAVLGNLEIIVE